jgi:hypothetical protein
VANLRDSHWQRVIAQAFMLEQEAESTTPEVQISSVQSASQLIVNANLLTGTAAEGEVHLINYFTNLQSEIAKEGDDSLIADLAAQEQTVTDGVVNRLENAIARIVDDALENGVSAVRTALSRSTKDGGREHHGQALNQLQRLATTVWSVLIL